MTTDLLLDSNPFIFDKSTDQLFFNSLRECASTHYHNNKYFKYLWDKAGLSPNDIKNDEDLANMPYIMVNVFKNHEMLTGKKEDVALTLGSSGTGGQRSLIYLNQESLDRVKKLAFNIHAELGMTSEKKYNYLCFTYDPSIADDLGTAFTDELLTNFTKKNEVFYTFKDDGEGFYFDEEATVAKLKEFEASKYPTRILGFPAFLYQIIKKYQIDLNLGGDSWVQTGGGWKGQADKEIPKEEFRDLVSKSLGLPIENIRDLFGMVEHGIPYVDNQDGELRIPNYARVIIRDPLTLKPLSYGEKGLIQFICTYNTSYPAMSLLTTDWGMKVQSSNKGDILKILGRAGVSKNKGCALKAAEMLN